MSLSALDLQAQPGKFWDEKVILIKQMLHSRCRSAKGSRQQHAVDSFWYELLLAMCIGCAHAVALPATLPGSNCSKLVWRSALCSMVPAAMQSLKEDGSSSAEAAKVLKALVLAARQYLRSCDDTAASHSVPISAQLLASFAEYGLLSDAAQSDPILQEHLSSKSGDRASLRNESTSRGMTLQVRHSIDTLRR